MAMASVPAVASASSRSITTTPFSSASATAPSSPRPLAFSVGPCRRRRLAAPSASPAVACLPQPGGPAGGGGGGDSTKLYISGLSFRTTEESLRNAFEKFGELTEVNLVMDGVAKRPRGFAFLRYANEEESKNAIEGMHGKFLDGRVIFVQVAKPRSEVRQDAERSPWPY